MKLENIDNGNEMNLIGVKHHPIIQNSGIYILNLCIRGYMNMELGIKVKIFLI
jgi:hypothetical protein